MRPLPPDRQSRLGLPPHLTRSRAWKLRQYLPHLQFPQGACAPSRPTGKAGSGGRPISRAHARGSCGNTCRIFTAPLGRPPTVSRAWQPAPTSVGAEPRPERPVHARGRCTPLSGAPSARGTGGHLPSWSTYRSFHATERRRGRCRSSRRGGAPPRREHRELVARGSTPAKGAPGARREGVHPRPTSSRCTSRARSNARREHSVLPRRGCAPLARGATAPRGPRGRAPLPPGPPRRGSGDALPHPHRCVGLSRS